MQKITAIKRWLLFLAVGLTGLLIFAGIQLHKAAPNFYTGSRPALTTARLHLERAYAEEKSLQEDLQVTHQEIKKTIQALRAASLDHDAAKEVDMLASRLQSMEDIGQLRQTTPEHLQQVYRNIQKRLDSVIQQSQ